VFDGGLHGVGLDVAEDGGFDAAEGEVEGGSRGGGVAALDGLEAELDGAGITVGGERIHPGAPGVAEAEELGDLVVGFAGGVVDGAAYVAIAKGRVGGVGGLFFVRLGEIEVGVAAGDDEGEQRGLRNLVNLLHEDRVDVAFQMIDGDERLAGGECERPGVGDADEEGTGEAGTFGDGDGVEIGEASVCLRECGADYGYDVAEMLAGGEFGDDAAVIGVERDLRGDYAGEDFAGSADDGGGGLVAGAFDAQYKAARSTCGIHTIIIESVARAGIMDGPCHCWTARLREPMTVIQVRCVRNLFLQIVLLLMLPAFALCGLSNASAQDTQSAAGQLPSAVMRPAVESLRQTLLMLRPERWKAASQVAGESAADIGSIERDLDTTLPTLLSAADAAPGSTTQMLAAYRNVDALYDVLVRVTQTAVLAAPQPQSMALQQATAAMQQSRRDLGDLLDAAVGTGERRLRDTQARLSALQAMPPPPVPVCPPPPAPPVKKAKPRAKPKPKLATSSATTTAPAVGH
jgi:hypothetical protein